MASAAQHHNHICFIDAWRGWYVEDRGIILHTIDGGDHWLPLNSGTTSNLNSVQFLPDGQHGWAAGDMGVILQTHDAGVHWHSQHSGVTQFLQGIQFLPDRLRGWAVIARGGLLHTTDGGIHWQHIHQLRNAQLSGVQFLAGGERGWAISYEGMIWHTADGGKTWQIQLTLPKDAPNIRPRLGTTPIYSIAMSADGEQGWAVGYGGTILRTSDGGSLLVSGGLRRQRMAYWGCIFMLAERTAGSLAPTVSCCIPRMPGSIGNLNVAKPNCGSSTSILRTMEGWAGSLEIKAQSFVPETAEKAGCQEWCFRRH